MVSSQEESIEPKGFSLKIPKFNRSSMNRYGIRNTKRPYSSSQKDPLSSVAVDEKNEGSIKINDDDCISIGSLVLDANKKRRTCDNKPRAGRTKKRSRKEVLASISANAKLRMPIPIPSFQMMKKRRRSDSQSKKLSQLERAFFDVDEGDDFTDNDPASSSRSNGDRVRPKAKTDKKGSSQEVNSDRCGKTKHIADASSDGIDRDSDFERESSSPFVEVQPQQNHKEDERHPKSQPTDALEEHIAKTCAMSEHKIMEADEPAKDFIHASPPSGESFKEKPLDSNININDKDENNDTKDESDTNCVDFGGDDSGCDFDHPTDGNCQELSSTNGHDKEIVQTNSATSAKSSPIEGAEIFHNESMPLSFHLEHQIDILFQKTDTNTITMKMFCKELEIRIGVSLEKRTKKKVKARVLSLLKGEIIPSSGVETKFATSGGQDKTEDGGTNSGETDSISFDNTESERENSMDNNSNRHIASMADSNQGKPSETSNLGTETQPIAVNVCEVTVINENRFSSSPNIEEAEAETSVSSRDPIILKKKKDELDRKQNEGKNASKHLTINSNKLKNSKKNNNEGNKPSENSNSVIEVPSMAERMSEVNAINEKRFSSSPNIVEAEKSIWISSQEPMVLKKKDGMDRNQNEVKIASKHWAVNQKSNSYCVQIEKEKFAMPEPDNLKNMKTDASKAKRQRKSKPKPSDSGDTTTDRDATAIAEKKPNRTRKRPRRATACALCKTCPCQRAHSGNDVENIATLDMKNFSRSNEAVERTLMRRLQKLEKSTESLEEQTETVRRRLKKHRRDIWKRRERERASTNSASATGDRTADSYFLPDAEIFEQQQNESQGLSGRVVGKAQTKVFQNVPNYQPTLFEMMGISRDGDKTKKSTDSKVNENIGNIGEETFLREDEESSYDDDDIPTEYVPEREDNEKTHRLEWNNDAGDSADKEAGVASGSIFNAILPLTKEHNDEIKNAEGKSLPLWDDLFKSKNRGGEKARLDTKAGLDDLLCLFEDGATVLNQEDDLGSVQTGKDQDQINLSLLSQDAQKVAKKVISDISSQEKTAVILEGSCPNWKENIYFALMQKDSDEIQEALDNVQQSRMRMQAQKEELLKAWECKNTALEVFETALKTSFERLNSNVSPALQE